MYFVSCVLWCVSCVFCMHGMYLWLFRRSDLVCGLYLCLMVSCRSCVVCLFSLHGVTLDVCGCVVLSVTVVITRGGSVWLLDYALLCTRLIPFVVFIWFRFWGVTSVFSWGGCVAGVAGIEECVYDGGCWCLLAGCVLLWLLIRCGLVHLGYTLWFSCLF